MSWFRLHSLKFSFGIVIFYRAPVINLFKVQKVHTCHSWECTPPTCTLWGTCRHVLDVLRGYLSTYEVLLVTNKLNHFQHKNLMNPFPINVPFLYGKKRYAASGENVISSVWVLSNCSNFNKYFSWMPLAAIFWNMLIYVWNLWIKSLLANFTNICICKFGSPFLCI